MSPQNRHEPNPFITSAPRRRASKRQNTVQRAPSQRSEPRQKTRKQPQKPLLPPLSPERKLDVLGILLALSGILLLISLATEAANQPPIVAALIGFLASLAGYGAFLVPFALITIGLWLVMRHIERLPTLTTGRLIGIVLLLLTFFTFLWLVGGQPLSGWLGSVPGSLFHYWLGTAGLIVVILAGLVISLVFTFDVSIPGLLFAFKAFYHRIERIWNPQALPQRSTQRPLPFPSGGDDNYPPELPEDFEPIEELPPASARSTSPRHELTPQRTPSPSVPSGQSALATGVGLTAEATPTVRTSIRQTSAVPWVLPQVDAILDQASKANIQAGWDTERARIIEETLASFGAPAHVVEIHRGPAITQFGVEPDLMDARGGGKVRVRVSQISARVDDLALALAAPRIRIQAPVPGRNFIGIEVPNPEITLVSLREVLESDSFRRIKSPLRFALGKDVSGKPVAMDLTKMPHLLIAGTTGSGKSVCVNSILCCLLMDRTPDELRLVLVDPKRVELTGYNGIPHLLTPVVVEPSRVVGALQWMLREMDSRYHRFSESGVRNIQEYNNKFSEKLPYLVVVVDELADLMMLAANETEAALLRLAQLARATGIHLILATQRPSTDIVTGLIKANFPARIAFAVASNTDSRVILDQPGAERLLGRGDMLFQAPDAPAPVRLQGTFVSEPEIQRLVETWRHAAATLPVQGGAEAEGDYSLPRGIPLVQQPLWDAQTASNEDPLLKEAIALVRREGRASISMLQRRMRIGYTRAARLVDSMESSGIIGPSLPNSQVREILDFGEGAPPKEE